jgi:membrane-associated phospholipid phosphatase
MRRVAGLASVLPVFAFATVMLGAAPVAVSQTTADEERIEKTTVPALLENDAENERESTLFGEAVADTKAYITAPSRWNGFDWALFGGAMGAVGLAHHYDSHTRTHFTNNSPYYLSKSQGTYDLQDAAPSLALLAGTWGAALLTDNPVGHNEAWAMLEAAAFGSATTYTLKFVAGREGPYQTTNPDLWFKGGSSFPSFHATFAFAVGTVMAESGDDEYRWLRRTLGYGVGLWTCYARVKHNQHWVSDTVAGAAIGAAAARFSMGRRYPQAENAYADGSSPRGSLSVVPIAGGGLMLTYHKVL